MFHWIGHLMTAAIIAWITQERKTLKDVLQGHLERRQDMINPVAILEDVSLAAEAVEKLKENLPLIAKTVADLKQAVSDKSDPTKLYLDLDALLADVNSDLALLQSLFPQAASLPKPPAAA